MSTSTPPASAQASAPAAAARGSNIVRAAITQTTWTGDKESMLDKHEKFARDAAADGAQIICFQELFYGPYFGITQDKKYYDFAESADGPIVQRFAALAKELGIVMILPIYEEEQPGVYYNTAVVVDSDGSILGKYRKHHIPHLDKFWEKFYFRPGNLGYPVFHTAVGPVGVYICYDRHFPEGWRELGLNGAQIVFNPNATKPGLSNRLWELEQPAAAAANGYFVAAPNRVGTEDNEYGDLAVTFYGNSQFADPQGNIVGGYGSGDTEEVVIRDLDLDMVRQVRNDWQFYRDRRPDSYTSIPKP
jgi:beta-ureidopropionase